MDMMRRRSEPGLSSEANDAEENRGDGGEERQQAPEVQALTDGREIARMQPIAQIEGEMVQGPAANPFWSERAHEEIRLRQSRPAASGGDRSSENTRRPPSLPDLRDREPVQAE